ncbi:hypothetical protein ID866_10756 [Astraeus odoratus]|nr:hypothetical protein ID866_10756 [Astraeus odoratus]
MSTHKLSLTMGALAMKSINWMKVSDKELATDLDNMDSRYGEQKRHNERQRSGNGNARWKRWKNTRRRRGSRKKQGPSRSGKLRRLNEVDQKAAAGRFGGPGKQKPDEHVLGVKKRSACGSCTKAKERCEWLEVEMMASRARTSPQGGEHKKWAKKVADDDDDEIVILSGQKTKWQGGGKTLEEITDRWWGELIQAVSIHMDVANGHLEWIASAAQSNGHKVQWHHLLMEGLVGQQQVLLSKLVEVAGATGSGGEREVIEDPEELKEP